MFLKSHWLRVCTLLAGTIAASSAFAESAAQPASSARQVHLIFGVGLHDEGTWTPVGQSDGMTFIVEVRSGQSVSRVFMKRKPKENPSPEYAAVDLSKWMDKAIEIRFVADPGPAGNAAYDWGVWIEPRIVEGPLPEKWWTKGDIFADGKLKVTFDAIDAYGQVVCGVGDQLGMYAGAQFDPAAIPLGWNIVPWAEKHCGKVKVRGILHEPAWDGQATASWGQYSVAIGNATVNASATVLSPKKKVDGKDEIAVAHQQVKDARELAKTLNELIASGRAKGLQMRLPRVTAAVLKVFCDRIDEDVDGIASYCGPNFPGWYYDGGKAEFHVSKIKLADDPKKFSPTYISDRRQRGLVMAPYLVRTAKRAIDEAKAILADSSLDANYPTVNYPKLKIRDGYFYDGEEPVLLPGLYTNRDVRDDYDALAEIGVSFSQPERLNAFTTLLSDTERSRAFIEGYVVRDTLVPAGKANVGCLFDIGLHYMPEWAYAKYPDMWNPGSKQNHYSPYSIISPNMRRLSQQYLDELIPTVAKYPMTVGYEMGNQPYLNPWSPEVIERFRTWARETYKTIDAANAKWHASFASFEAINPDENFRKIEPLGLRYDWLKFQQSLTSEWYSWLKAELNKRDPGRPVTVQPAGNFFEPQKFAGHDWHRVGIDDVELNRNITDISGFDGCTWYWGRMVFDQTGTFIDLLRSIAPNKPTFNFEYAFSTYNSKTVWNPDYIRASMWYNFLHGLGGCSSWIWTVAEDIDDSQCNSFSRWPDRTEQFGRAALEIQRHAKTIVQFGRPKSQIAILYSGPSRYFAGTASNDYCEQARAAWIAATFLGAPFDFVTDEHIAEGKLSQYKLLIVPTSPYLQDGTRKHIVEFVKAGGVMVVNEGSFAFDDYANPRNASEILGPVRTIFDYTAGRQKPRILGSGAVYTIPPADGAGYYPLLDRACGRAKIDRPIRVRLANGASPYWTIESRTVVDHAADNADGRKHYLFYCFNVSNEAANVAIAMPKGWRVEGNDLVENRAFSEKQCIRPLGIHIWKVVAPGGVATSSTAAGKMD